MALHGNDNYLNLVNTPDISQCERALSTTMNYLTHRTYPFVSAFPPNGDQPFFLSDFLE